MNIAYKRAILRREDTIAHPVCHHIECHVDGCSDGTYITLPASDDPAELEYTCPYHNGFIYGGGQGRLRRIKGEY